MSIKIITKNITIHTRGNTDIIDITREIEKRLKECGLSTGFVTLFIGGSTASLTTIEYEPNLIKDLKDAFERLAPSGIEYAHTRTWGDHNGHSHIRASLMGPSIQIPFADKRLLLGRWQQAVLIDFDTGPRHRDILIQFTGE